ncbi:bifunctional [glutamate--ammonia ligase]-adenylyl-L-tyrosine phosphorylase/[glutamate--ammonia-ligase] adenylyltransferase [Polaromonas sp.]|uniref:bifunctional [glutamate--ammonia ligase]-adenylyl-L-tyrosine phosphorylase/[glutamate--ammonia-ligase] adenylyltransferase n=1 Tax=Polaromonas sp. TaxID=1869339 RepID=UPI001801FC8F|nr:bifunctional [glutamate--ammonia ligase]-adenylyl-L-tyrosine phosphorylase/[glutamate--ammonia-ligase] adenylyltransferase [Polaromonas sp.]NMM07884.1 bifunctional [glutamate--ammonia ligase]-adenylyl-L-tyrosine phosphorylase/[glutamate--ammonia-ligase] adenylyltransferase [Polaromonas sp.]
MTIRSACTDTPADIGAASAYSRFVQRIRRRYAQQLPLLPEGAPLRPAMQATLDALLASGLETGAALRLLRQLVLERLVVLDCDVAPTLPAARGSLPPEGAGLAWGGPALAAGAPTLPAAYGSLPPEGALRLRPREAGSAAPAGGFGDGPAAAPPLAPVHPVGVALHVVTQAMTELAELVLDVAMRESSELLDTLYGAPLAAGGARAHMWVVGMGKLGARELNVSSDIDLIYVYDQDGETAGRSDGRGQISNHEYFAHQVRAVYSLIGDTTEHGFVFRVDLALRPHGGSGLAAMALSALEEYFQTQGREWERFAWLKSRVVAPSPCIASGAAQALRGAVLPFVFRRYLDYNVFDGLRALQVQIREHAAKRCAGHPERANDVKMSRGGIREIEFTVQLLQVVRGGQFPELRTRPTLDALQRLARAGLMPQDTADALARAYEFLRRVEHRIQYLDDQQTHVLPTRDDDLDWIARTIGFSSSCLFLSELDAHRELVAGEFDRLLGGKPGCTRCVKAPTAPPQQLEELLEQLPEHWPAQFRARLALWRQHPRVGALREDSRARLARLLQRTALWLGESRVTEEAAVRLIDWVEPLLRRESYLALLLERPAVHERLLRLLGAAKWPARYLLQHPGVIDELASDQLQLERFDSPAFVSELQQRLAALRRTREDDEESSLDLLRRAHHAEVFRTLARDVEGTLTVEQVADDLSALAEAVLRLSADWCWQHLKNRHRETPPQFAIIAYGKLGGKELGYGGDLDIVFVYDDEDERAPEVYAAFVRKLIKWLTIKTGEGDLYEIDTALRPNGNSGLLVTSFASYAAYQQQRGSNTAWTWEHQAMTRARCVLGDAALRERFDRVREAVISAPREPVALRNEIVAMREKVRMAHHGQSRQSQMMPLASAKFDVKHSAGGMVDAEFAVQFLVLSQSAQHAELLDNVGNIALLQRAEAASLLPEGIGQRAAAAYRELRRVQHQARLNEEPTQVSPSALQAERDAILALWCAVFDAR